VWRRRPSSRTPAFSHLSTTPSVTRRSRKITHRSDGSMQRL
jgi:hypothetical protein